MAQFYKELKELRVSKEISLEELETKTKINFKYLEAIESGNFDILPVPYLRLFIRAYAIEIGGDSERALEQLDSFIGHGKPISKPKMTREKIQEKHSAPYKMSFESLLSKSNLKLRRDFITVLVLSVLFIFSIFIIKEIFSNEIKYPNNTNEKKIIREVEIISEENLISNYTEDKFIEESLPIDPPFFLKISSNNNIGISIKQDTLESYNQYLSPGTEINLEGFVSRAELLFTNTSKIKVRLNGIELNQIKNHPHPLKLSIKASPPSFNAKLYKPLN